MSAQLVSGITMAMTFDEDIVPAESLYPDGQYTQDQSDKEYGLIRRDKSEDDGNKAWIVNFKRRGRLINRYFADAYFGGPDAAYDAARSYRDAVTKAFPPLTTRESALRVRVNNRSGVSGVAHCYRLGEHYGWSALIEDHGERRTRLFSFSRYGDEAFERAVECRLEWVAAKQARFHTQNSQANAVANLNFSELLERDHIDDRTLEGFNEKLSMVDAAFYANFPRLVHVSANAVTDPCNKPLIIRGRLCSSTFAKRYEPVVSFTNRTLAECLLVLKTRIDTILQTQCGVKTSQAFSKEHGRLFTKEGFDLDKGFSVCIKIAD